MMSKTQKIWLWIFGAMFVVIEILFSFILSIVGFFGKNISPLYMFFVSQQFFIDHPLYLLVANAIEWAGVLGLLIISIKSKKRVLIVPLVIILLWLSLDFYLGYVLTITMNIP